MLKGSSQSSPKRNKIEQSYHNYDSSDDSEYYDYYLVIDSNNNYYLLNGKTKDGKFQLSGVSKVINISNNYFE